MPLDVPLDMSLDVARARCVEVGAEPFGLVPFGLVPFGLVPSGLGPFGLLYCLVSVSYTHLTLPTNREV